MPKIAIMTDSNCGITPDDAQKYHIHILPMPVLVGEDTFMKDAISHQKSFTGNFLPENLLQLLSHRLRMS